MKTTILSLALGLTSLTFAQTPAPAAPATTNSTKPAPAAAKSTRKHTKRAVKKTVKANPAGSVQAPVK